MSYTAQLDDPENNMLQQRAYNASYLGQNADDRRDYVEVEAAESRQRRGILSWFRRARDRRRRDRDGSLEQAARGGEMSHSQQPPQQQLPQQPPQLSPPQQPSTSLMGVQQPLYYPTSHPNRYAVQRPHPHPHYQGQHQYQQYGQQHEDDLSQAYYSDSDASAPYTDEHAEHLAALTAMHQSHSENPLLPRHHHHIPPHTIQHATPPPVEGSIRSEDLPKIQIPAYLRRQAEDIPTPSFYQKPMGGIDTPFQRVMEERPILRTPSPIGRRRHRQKGLLHLNQPVDVLYWVPSATTSDTRHTPGGFGTGFGSGVASPHCGISTPETGDVDTGHGHGDRSQLSNEIRSHLSPPLSASHLLRSVSSVSSASTSSTGGVPGGMSSPGISHPVWLPGRVLDLRGDVVKVQIYVPPRGMPQGTRTVAEWLRRLSSQDGYSSHGEYHSTGRGTEPVTRNRMGDDGYDRDDGDWFPQLKVLELHKTEVPLRISVPAGFRSNVSGEAIQSLWPGTGHSLVPGTAAYAKESEEGDTDGGVFAVGPLRGTSRESRQTSGEGASEAPIRRSSLSRRPIPPEFSSQTVMRRDRQPRGHQAAGETKKSVSFIEAVSRSPLQPGLQEERNNRMASIPLFTPFRGTISDVIQADAEQHLPGAKGGFLSMLQVGQEIDAHIHGHWRRGLVMRILTDGDLDPLVVQGQRKKSTKGPEDTIGRGGFPLLPTPMVTDVLLVQDNSIERVPLLSTFIAPARSKTHGVLHTYKIGDAVDVLQGRRSQIIIPDGLIDMAAESMRDVVSNTLVVAKDIASRIRYTQWRVGIVEKRLPGMLQIRYCELTDHPNPPPLLTAPETEGPSLVESPLQLLEPPQYYQVSREPPVTLDMDREAFRVRSHVPGQIEVDRDQSERFLDQREGTRFLMAMKKDDWEYWEPEIGGAHSTALPPILSLFHAVCHQIYGEAPPERVAAVVDMVSDHMRQYCDFYEPLVEAYVGKGDRGQRPLSGSITGPRRRLRTEPVLRIQTNTGSAAAFRLSDDSPDRNGEEHGKPVVTLDEYLRKIDFITGANMRYTVEGEKMSCPASSLSVYPYSSFSPPLLGYCYPTLLAIEEVFDRPALVWRGEEFFLRKGIAMRHRRSRNVDDSAFLPPPRNIHSLETSTPPALISLVLVPHITPFRLAYLGGGRWASVFPRRGASMRRMRQIDERWKRELQETDISFRLLHSSSRPHDIPYLRPDRPPLGLLYTKKIVSERLRVLGHSKAAKEIVLSHDHIAELRYRATGTPRTRAQWNTTQAYSCLSPMSKLAPGKARIVELGSCLSAAESSGKECAEAEVRKHVRRIASTYPPEVHHH